MKDAMRGAGRSVLAGVVAVGLGWGVAQAQVAGTEPSAENRTITLSVHVTDKSGQAIRGLQASDFTVLDNKQAQKVTGFRVVDPKASPSDQTRVVIVLDTINTGIEVVSRERVELGSFLKENGGELPAPTSLAILAESGAKMEQGWTADGKALLAELNKQGSELRTIGRDTGFYGAVERLQMSLEQFEQLLRYEEGQPGRKMLLVISPGWPLFPYSGNQADMRQRTQVFNSIVQSTNRLRETRTMIYTLDPYELGRSNPFFYQTYLKGVAQPKDAEYGDMALQVLSEHSGGRVLVSGRDITAELNTAMQDVGSSYELSFAAAPGDRPNEYHAVQVKVDKPNAVARTSAGYYAHPQPLDPRR